MCIMSLNKKIIKYKLIERHIQLTKGSFEDLEVANRLLHFLNKGEIRLGLGDIDFRTELELENTGIHISYSRNYCSAYARL